jgi:hypothetical protein
MNKISPTTLNTLLRDIKSTITKRFEMIAAAFIGFMITLLTGISPALSIVSALIFLVTLLRGIASLLLANEISKLISVEINDSNQKTFDFYS